MTLNEAMDILQKEFPGVYTSIYTEINYSPHKDIPREIKWKVYVGGAGSGMNEMSDNCPTLEVAIQNVKHKLGIDQPIPEDVEVM